MYKEELPHCPKCHSTRLDMDKKAKENYKTVRVEKYVPNKENKVKKMKKGNGDA